MRQPLTSAQLPAPEATGVGNRFRFNQFMQNNGQTMGGDIGSLLGMFMGGDAGQPYSDAANEFSQYYNQAAGYQQPYLEAGKTAIPEYEQYLSKMQSPSAYISKLLSQYHASPAEQYAQQQAMKASENAAAASGMIGSTPFQEQAQKNAANIANQYQQQWLQNVLGVGQRYGQGLGNLIGVGQGAANQMTGLSEEEANALAEMKYAQEQAQQQQQGQEMGAIGGLIGDVASFL